MLSFQSLIFTIFAVIAIWKGFSLLSKLRDNAGTSPARSKPAADQPQAAAEEPSIELVPCPRCGAYVDPKEGCHCGAGAA